MNHTKEMAVSEKVTKVSENMTRSQKNRQRKAKRSSKQAKLPNLPPYRLSTILAGGSRHSTVMIDKNHIPRSLTVLNAVADVIPYNAF